MPIAVPLPYVLPLPNKPNTIAVRARGEGVPLVVGRIEGNVATWVQSPDSPAWSAITAAAFVGDDLWITSGYMPHQLWRCAVGDDLVATCSLVGKHPHDNANGTLVAVPADRCDHPKGALLDIDTPPDAEDEGQPHDAHLYDIASGQWTALKRPTGERRELAKTLTLRDGRVLFVGGLGVKEPVASTEIFDGKTLVAGPTLAASRYGQGMTLLPDGRVLVSGGYSLGFETGAPLPSWEIVDVAAGTATLSTQPTADTLGRGFATATGALGNCGYVSLSGRNPDQSAAIDYFAFAQPGFVRLPAPLLPDRVEYGATTTLSDGSLVYLGGRTPGLDGGIEGDWTAKAYRLAKGN